jgi:predicted enzyme related to lactoylglutathione lyase
MILNLCALQSPHHQPLGEGRKGNIMLANAPVLTSIPVVDFERAVGFYQDALGLRLIAVIEEAGLALFEAGAGTRLFLYQRGPTTADHTVASFVVEDTERAVRELSARGVVFEQYDLPGLKTNAMGIAELGPAKSAWFKDTEGNIIAVGTMLGI